jgi:hypothetical protein
MMSVGGGGESIRYDGTASQHAGHGADSLFTGVGAAWVWPGIESSMRTAASRVVIVIICGTTLRILDRWGCGRDARGYNMSGWDFAADGVVQRAWGRRKLRRRARAALSRIPSRKMNAPPGHPAVPRCQCMY